MLSKTILASLFVASALAAPSSVSKRDIPSTGGKSVIDVIDYWRAQHGVPNLEWSDQLAANAQKTGDDDGGNVDNQQHELNPGSYGQVIGPGRSDQDACGADFDGQTPFGLNYVAWLCEVPSDPEYNGNCQKWLDLAGIYVTGTGHHDILTNPDYKTIGCAYSRNPNKPQCDKYSGLWVCDLGY